LAIPKIKDLAARRKAPARERRNPIAAITQYVREVRTEFRKVLWPGRADIVSATIVVLSALAFFIIFTGVFDFIFQQLITAGLP